MSTIDACIGSGQVVDLLDTVAKTDLIRTDVDRDILGSSEMEPYRGRLED